MTEQEIFSNLYTVTWQQGIIYPEQNRALLDALKLIDPRSTGDGFVNLNELIMRAGETARHIGRIIKGEVWKPAHFRLTKEQKEALEQAEKMLLQIEDNLLDYEKGRYD